MIIHVSQCGHLTFLLKTEADSRPSKRHRSTYCCQDNGHCPKKILSHILLSFKRLQVSRKYTCSVSKNEFTYFNDCQANKQGQKSTICTTWPRSCPSFTYDTYSIESACVSSRAFPYRMDTVRPTKGAQVEMQWNGERWGENCTLLPLSWYASCCVPFDKSILRVTLQNNVLNTIKTDTIVSTFVYICGWWQCYIFRPFSWVIFRRITI
jgi:hypothetical protein